MNRRLPGKHAKQAARLRQAAGVLLRAVGALTIAAAITTGSVAGWRWMRTGARFAIRTIEVTGVHRASRDDLVARSGLERGQNIFSVNTASAAAAVGRAEWVRHVRVTRALPDTVVVAVEEREPFAVLSAGGLTVVDSDGEKIKDASSADGLDLPVLSGLASEGAASDDHSAAIDRATALAIAHAWQEHAVGKLAPLSELHVSKESGETTYTAFCGDDPAVEVRLGAFDAKSATEIGDVLNRFQRVLTELQREGRRAQTIDLGNRQRPDWVPTRLVSPEQVVARSDGVH
jgi:hypothetical protein